MVEVRRAPPKVRRLQGGPAKQAALNRQVPYAHACMTRQDLVIALTTSRAPRGVQLLAARRREDAAARARARDGFLGTLLGPRAKVAVSVVPLRLANTPQAELLILAFPARAQQAWPDQTAVKQERLCTSASGLRTPPCKYTSLIGRGIRCGSVVTMTMASLDKLGDQCMP